MQEFNARAIAERNPYAPPEADITSSEASDEIHREGDLLVIPRLCTLPPRCVKCNAPQDGAYLVRKLYWHAAGWYFLLFFNLIIYAAVAMSVRKTATVYYALCAAHRKTRRRDRGIIIALLVGGLALGIAGPALEVPGLLAVLPLAWIAAGIYSVVRTNTLRPVRIDSLNARVRGASPAFLASLPR